MFSIVIVLLVGIFCSSAKAHDDPLGATLADPDYADEKGGRAAFVDHDYEDMVEGSDFWKEVIWNPNRDPVNSEEDSSGYKVVCYFPNWAGYRKPPAMFLPRDVDAEHCTHIHYLQISVDPSTLHLIPSDSYADFDKNFFEEIVFHKTKRPALKVLATLDGSRATSDEYHRLLSSAKEREHFIENVVDFLTEYDFDGLDLILPLNIDKKDVSMFLQEMRETFDEESHRLLMSASVSAKREIVERIYDVDVLAKCLDYIHVMTYDYHDAKGNSTGHQASLDDVEASMALWVKLGVPSSKLILGIASYGRSFVLSNVKYHGVGAHAIGPGDPGSETAEKGILSYTEIGENILREKWQKVASHQGCYAYQGAQWVSYDDPQTVLRKGRLVTRNNYGGMALRDLSTDDFQGRICRCKYPLLQAMNSALERDTTCFSDNCP